MCNSLIRLFALALVGAASARCGQAAPLTIYPDQASFVAGTGAVPEAPVPNLGLVGRTGTVYTLGRLTFSVSATDPTVALFFAEFNPVNPGNELTMSSVEDLDVHVNTPVHGLGFSFVEGTDSPASCSAQCSCTDATFEVSLFLGAQAVGQFSFNAPDDQLAFYGIRSIRAFDGVRFRDLSHACDNEYWGRFFLADAPQCLADLDDGTGRGLPDGGVDITDLLYFLAAYEAGGLGADLDDGSATGTPDGAVTIEDLLFFLASFEAGC